MWETLQNNAGWDCFKTPTLREILRTPNLLPGGTLCVFGSHTFVPISWMCKKQTSVSHSSTESEIIFLDAGLRLDGIPALDFWDLIVATLHGNTYQSNEELTDPYTNTRAAPHKFQKRKKSQRVINDLYNVDFIHSNVTSSHQEALLYVFEDNEAVIKMIIKGRTHRVAIDWLFDIWTPRSKSNFLTPKNNLQTFQPKENFPRDEWNHLLCLFNISHFSSAVCSEVMSKR